MGLLKQAGEDVHCRGYLARCRVRAFPLAEKFLRFLLDLWHLVPRYEPKRGFRGFFPYLAERRVEGRRVAAVPVKEKEAAKPAAVERADHIFHDFHERRRVQGNSPGKSEMVVGHAERYHRRYKRPGGGTGCPFAWSWYEDNASGSQDACEQ